MYRYTLIWTLPPCAVSMQSVCNHCITGSQVEGSSVTGSPPVLFCLSPSGSPERAISCTSHTLVTHNHVCVKMSWKQICTNTELVAKAIRARERKMVRGERRENIERTTAFNIHSHPAPSASPPLFPSSLIPCAELWLQKRLCLSVSISA